MNSRFWLLTTPWRTRYYLVHIKDGLGSHWWFSLVPRRRGEGGERAPSTHCLRRYFITMEFHGDCVCTYMYIHWWCHKLAWCWCASWPSVRLSFISRCYWVEHLKIKLKKEQVASNECVYRGNMPLWVIHQFWQVNYYHCLLDISLCTQQYKTRQSM